MDKKDGSDKIKVEFSPPLFKGMNPLQDSIKPISAALSAFSKPIVIQGLDAISMTAKVGESLSAIVKSYQQHVSVIASKVVALLEELPYHAFSNVPKLIDGIDFSDVLKGFEKIYYEEMVAARWFPHENFVSSTGSINKLIDIISHTRQGSKARTKELNKFAFDLYDKYTLKYMFSNWKKKTLPKHILRMMCEAIKAYNCGWYASTVSILVPLWQGLIQQKATGTSESRTDAKTKAELQIIVQDNPHAKIIEAFCDEYIFYPCYSLEQVKDDVPGRHGVCHSWHKEYPTRKTALNAIIFTDFLLSLYPVENKEENNG